MSEMLPGVPVGLVGLGLVADPAFGAAQALRDGLGRDVLLEKLQSDILGSSLSRLDTALPTTGDGRPHQPTVTCRLSA